METPNSTPGADALKRRGRQEGSSPQRRPGTAGNIIWRIYQDEIGEADRIAFRKKLDEAEVPYVTFLAHTKADRRLDSLTAGHLKLYRDFFYLATDAKYDLNTELAREVRNLGPRPKRVHKPRKKKAEATA